VHRDGFNVTSVKRTAVVAFTRITVCAKGPYGPGDREQEKEEPADGDWLRTTGRKKGS
jgi:hypothetical protein